MNQYTKNKFFIDEPYPFKKDPKVHVSKDWPESLNYIKYTKKAGK